MTADELEQPPIHKPILSGDEMVEHLDHRFSVTITRTTRYSVIVTADSPGEAAGLVGDRVRKGYLDGIVVDELGLTDLTVRRIDARNAL